MESLHFWSGHVTSEILRSANRTAELPIYEKYCLSFLTRRIYLFLLLSFYNRAGYPEITEITNLWTLLFKTSALSQNAVSIFLRRFTSFHHLHFCHLSPLLFVLSLSQFYGYYQVKTILILNQPPLDFLVSFREKRWKITPYHAHGKLAIPLMPAANWR